MTKIKNITIYFPYYESPHLLKYSLNLYSNFPEILRKKIFIFIVDDGSQKFNISKLIKNYTSQLNNLNITIYRINKNILWNQSEANNLALKYIKTEYVIRSDIDHVYTEENLENIFKNNFEDKLIYFFKDRMLYKLNNKFLRKLKRNPNIFIISKSNYWETKGYNEYYSGSYGDDLDYIPRCLKILKERKLNITINAIRLQEHNLDRSLENYKIKKSKKQIPHLTFQNKKFYQFIFENYL